MPCTPGGPKEAGSYTKKRPDGKPQAVLLRHMTQPSFANDEGTAKMKMLNEFRTFGAPVSAWTAVRVATLVFVCASPGAARSAPATDDVQGVANGFYAVYGTFRPSDGIPDAKGRTKYEPFISLALDRLLIEGEAAEQRFVNATKNMSPPLIEGDLFTSNFEGATSWSVGPCETGAATAHCMVALGYRGGSKEDSKPVNWTDTIYLVRNGAGWRVDDIAYGAPWAFGNKGRLTQTLQSAIRDGNNATQ
jgi:hypothetical protein